MSKKEEFESFTSEALRFSKKGSWELLLAQHLGASVMAEPISKVRLILEGSYMTPAKKSELNMEKIDTLYSICLSFLNTVTKSDFIAVPWTFEQTQENYSKYVEPWMRKVPICFSSATEMSKQNKRKQLEQAESDAEKFFLYTGELNLHLSSFQILKGLFLRWSLPQAMTIFETLSKLVDPELYQNIVLQMKKETSK